MASLQSDDLIGFTVQLKAYLAKYKTQLVAKKYDPTDDMTQLDTDAGVFATEGQLQETMKTDLKKQTTKVEGLGGELYNFASSTLDAAVGKLGKTTPEGQEGLKIRSTLKGRGPNKPKTPPPGP